MVMAALVEEGLRHRKKHQLTEKDTAKPSSIETRLELFIVLVLYSVLFCTVLRLWSNQ